MKALRTIKQTLVELGFTSVREVVDFVISSTLLCGSFYMMYVLMVIFN